MNSENADVLKKVCCDVFEQLAFMFGEVLEPEEVESEADAFIKASMQYKGSHSGSIDIIMPRELTQSLSYNILGIDEDEELDSGSAEDALKELLNTICGRMMTSLYGETAVIDLTVPQTVEMGFGEWEAAVEAGDFLAVDIEDNPVLISFT